MPLLETDASTDIRGDTRGRLCDCPPAEKCRPVFRLRSNTTVRLWSTPK